MSIVGVLLLPLTFIYSLIIRLRNHLFNIGYTRSFSFEIPVIGVGNLSMGGAGKTPMVEYLIRLLSRDYKVATLSRGYGRKTSGIIIASNRDSAQTLGDEAFQIYQKFGKGINVAVAEERALAIPVILQEYENTEVIILDDSFQHRYVSPGINILLTPYGKPFYRDFLLPSGRLREPRKEACRADVVIVTKCPAELDEEEMTTITGKIQKYAGKKIDIYFTYVKYQDKVRALDGVGTQNGIIGFAGIAYSRQFEQYLHQLGTVLEFQKFKDHYSYTWKDLRKLAQRALEWDAALYTTEKDFSRISGILKEADIGCALYYIPIETVFLKYGKRFDEYILNTVTSLRN